MHYMILIKIVKRNRNFTVENFRKSRRFYQFSGETTHEKIKTRGDNNNDLCHKMMCHYGHCMFTASYFIAIYSQFMYWEMFDYQW